MIIEAESARGDEAEINERSTEKPDYYRGQTEAIRRRDGVRRNLGQMSSAAL